MTQQPYETSIPLPPEGVTEEYNAQLNDSMDTRQKSSLAMYRLHHAAHSLGRYRLVTYRCQRRCLLLDVFRTTAGPAVYFPPVKLSPEKNERTAPDARIERTSDGVRRYVDRAETLSVYRGGLWMELNCDHISRRVLIRAEVEAAIEQNAGATTITLN